MTDNRSNSLSRVPFQYIAGDPALDLVNTVDWTSRGPEAERLTDFEQLTRWAQGAGILSSRNAGTLRHKAESNPRDAETAYQSAVRTRDVLQRLFSSIAGDQPDSDALEEFNRSLGRALEHMEVMPAMRREPSRRLRLGWKDSETRLDSVLWPVLWSAASLLASDEISQIRICGGPDCGWMYVDRSRNGLRRWCQMETCGTREKTRRRYERAVQR